MNRVRLCRKGDDHPSTRKDRSTLVFGYSRPDFFSVGMPVIISPLPPVANFP